MARQLQDPYLSEEDRSLPRLDSGYRYFALDGFLAAGEFAGMLVAVGKVLGESREQALTTIGQAAAREGKTLEESLKAYFELYTDGQIPTVIPYGGRIQSRGL